ncbi:hypothetical protein PIROE2DRAFT_65275 [Piromyces sp. E2]|nr:hypothetical protein PIROE2DRAFT_65275 [Piromyces sp. E2]|eukprot:OUM56961.1 hypothetical protein PIROE2DRAFT_65275 [Piromyces sp. E2]
MMSSNSFNSSYQFADSLCYTASMSPVTRSLSKSYPSPVRPISYSGSRKSYRRSYGWTSEGEPDMVERKRQNSSFIGGSYGNLKYIDYDSDSDSDSDSYDSDSGSTLNNDTILSPSVLSEATIYSSTGCSSTDNSLRSSLSPKTRMVSFCEEVDIIKPPMVESSNKKNILKKAFKIIKMKKKEVN